MSKSAEAPLGKHLSVFHNIESTFQFQYMTAVYTRV